MTPTTEVRYGEPVDVLREGVWLRPITNTELRDHPDSALRSVLQMRDAIDAALLRVRYAYEDCPECRETDELISVIESTGEFGALPLNDCSHCSGSARWGIPAGTVRVKCDCCDDGTVEDASGWPGASFEDALYGALPVPCPEIEAGRCYEGYRVKQS